MSESPARQGRRAARGGQTVRGIARGLRIHGHETEVAWAAKQDAAEPHKYHVTYNVILDLNTDGYAGTVHVSPTREWVATPAPVDDAETTWFTKPQLTTAASELVRMAIRKAQEATT